MNSKKNATEPLSSSGVLADDELLNRLRTLHEEIQVQRKAIAEEEPHWEAQKCRLWAHLLDAEYYLMTAAEELEELQSANDKAEP